MNLLRSYKRMKWYTKLGVWGSLASLAALPFALSTCGGPKSTFLQSSGAQSPVISTKGEVSITYGSPSSADLTNTMRDTSRSIMSQTVEETLRQMDTNRIRLEALTEEYETARLRSEENMRELEATRIRLASALHNIAQLKSNLESNIDLTSLSASDQARIQSFQASVMKANHLSVDRMYVGTQIVGKRYVPDLNQGPSSTTNSTNP